MRSGQEKSRERKEGKRTKHMLFRKTVVFKILEYQSF